MLFIHYQATKTTHDAVMNRNINSLMTEENIRSAHEEVVIRKTEEKFEAAGYNKDKVRDVVNIYKNRNYAKIGATHDTSGTWI